MSIHLLPPEVASQIAAGEVIERPASVVKELLENALDAGASVITVTIEGAGQRLVEVADNGSGIPADELTLAVERHATSKLQSADDLFSIQTLGFRGEALASIGSVARLTLTSRPTDSAVGARLHVEGGLSGDAQPVGAPAGTVMRVEDLFYNVPARLKFLKADATERRQIDTLVTRYALAYPQVRFTLKQDGRPALQTSGNGNRREVLAALYGVEVAQQMLEVIAEEEFDDAGGLLTLRGFISPTSLTRSNRREITFFVNGRPVQDASLVAALIQGYHTLLMVGRYPLAILFVEMPPESVDVNVHPTKAEVRFRQADRVFSVVQRSVRRALLAHTPVPQVGGQLRWTAPGEQPAMDREQPPVDGEYFPTQNKPWSERQPLPVDEGPLSLSPLASRPFSPLPLAALSMPLLRLIGQVAGTYLVAEGPDGLYLIDQHAAHERVLFEKLMAGHEHEKRESEREKRESEREGRESEHEKRESEHEKRERHESEHEKRESEREGRERHERGARQGLLQPVAVDLPPASAGLLNEQLPWLEHFGFEVEPFGPATFLVRAVPLLLAGMDPGSALRVLVEDFEEDETPLQAELEARIAARVCKRAAVKAGQSLSPQEQRALLDDLQACRSPRTCPHGRPTMIHLSVDLLERQFGRKGAR